MGEAGTGAAEQWGASASGQRCKRGAPIKTDGVGRAGVGKNLDGV